MIPVNTISDILLKSLQGTLTETEQHTLDNWLADSVHNQQLFAEINNGDQLREQILEFSNDEQEKTEKEIWNKINEQLIPKIQPSIGVHRWWKYGAAAAIIIAIAVYFWQAPKSSVRTIASTSAVNDISPGSDQATLILNDGREVRLGTEKGKIIDEGNRSIRNENGTLYYTPSSVTAINTMKTPKGGQYKLKLEDGTMVWLNAASSITYPVTFRSGPREVSITGEAYFEVTANQDKPFIVHTPNERIAVLGTRFNVNAYQDEPYSKTSLAQGKIQVQETVLAPGQAYENGKMVSTNIQQDLAWTNGSFYFDHTPIEAVLRQISRWYNIDVIYKSEIPDVECTGELLRKLKLSQMLTALQQLGVRCQIDNKNRLIIN